MARRLFIGIALCGLLFAQGSLVFSAQPADNLAFQRALAQRNSGINAFRQGQSAAAQDSLIAAYDTFMRLQRYDYASLCLYERAIEYMNIGAFDQMEVLMQQLQALTDYDLSTSENCEPLVLFNYYSVASAYYAQLDSGDLAIRYGEQSIRAMEQLPDPEQWRIIPPWNYYNQALYYDFYTDPRQTDSIEAYLQRAEQAAALLQDPLDQQEVRISIMDLQAWLCYYRRQYRAAEQIMREVLAMIDSVEAYRPNTIITERGEAFSFMVTLCTEQGRYREALEWQERLIENNAIRYDIDKTASLQEIETRYEVEKQTIEMERLQERNLAFRRLLYLSGSLLLCAILLIVVLYLRKKNTEAKLYEAALEADNMRSAVDAMKARPDNSVGELLTDNLIRQLQALPADTPYRASAIERLKALDTNQLTSFFAQGRQLTNMDKRYIVCFAAGMSADQIAHLFHIETASVYTVRYRLRKKFPADTFPYG
ncbi:MAG: helix-turn-helix transcriptional regulator [Paludibacteraceae bacterium]